MMGWTGQRAVRWAALLLPLLNLLGCDAQRIAELEEGVSTQADVRQRFGEPEATWDTPDGSRVLSYSRQPEGDTNYQITIGPDGKMTALRQVLTPRNFEQIVPGMSVQEVRRRLGKPMKVTEFERLREVHYDWRYRDGPNNEDRKIFTVVASPELTVVSTRSVRDPDLDRSR